VSADSKPEGKPEGEAAGEVDEPGGLSAPNPRRQNPHAWLVTFTDLVALMLTFFVMMFAMSAVKTADWQTLTDSLKERLSTLLDQPVASPTFRLDMPSSDRTPGADLDYVGELLRSQLAESQRLDDVVIRRESRRVFVSLPADMLFRSGDYELTETSAKAVFELGGVLRNLANRIEVAGHADPRQPKTRYPSNWELSLLRAQSVAAALRQAGYDAPVVARGYGDSQYGELPGSMSEARRQSLARRVDIVIGASAQESP
jgi:chemotaxis protein MotB